MSTPEEVVSSQAATPDDVRSALDTISPQGDPDVIPAGSTQATTTEEAQKEARKILSRIGKHEEEVTGIGKDIEASAEKSKQALRNAQQLLLQNYWALQPSEHELALRQQAAAMRPNPQAGVWGALGATAGNIAQEQAAQEAEQRKALLGYLQEYGGADLAEKMRGIDLATAEGKRKLYEMIYRQEGELGKSAMTALGRLATTPAAQAAQKPQGNFGRNALDLLGAKAYNKPGDPTSGFSPAYHALVKSQLDASIAEAKARAGIDTTPENIDDKIANANAAGVPFNPYAYGLPDVSHMSTRERTQYYQREEADAQKKFATYGDADSASQAAMRALDEFQQLNKNENTGPQLAPWSLAGAHVGPHGAGVDLSQERGGLNLNLYGYIQSYNSNIQRMNKLAGQVVAQAIPPKGFGRVTNRDLNLFQQSSIGIDKNRITNDSIAQALRVRLENDIERHNFEQAYFGRHRSLQGSEAAWNDYLNANPILEKDWDPRHPTAIPKLNKDRQDWRTWFRSQNPQVAETPESAGPPGTIEPDVSYHPQASDTAEAHAEGGRVGMEEGGKPIDPDINTSLNALKQGLTLKASGAEEDPSAPGTNFFGELAGGTASAALALAALRNRAAREYMVKHPNLTATGVGTVAGGVAGGMGNQGEFLPGAAQGAMLGPLAAAAMRHGSTPLLRITNALTREAGPGVRKSLTAINLDRPDQWKEISDIMGRDARLGVNTTLAEAAGPRSVGLTSAALGKDTPETNALLGELQERQAQSGAGTQDIINQGLKPDDYYAKTEALRNELYTKAKPLYEQAYAQFPSIRSQALMSLMNTPSGQEAATRAFRMMQDMQIPIGNVDVAGMVRSPSLQYLDNVKRALDDMIIGEEKTGVNYQATQQGRILRDMRSKLVDELDKSTMGPNGRSPYRAARDQYAGDLDIMDALRSGRETFDKLTAQEVQQLMGKLDWSARDAYRTGVAEGIMQKVGNMAGNRNAAQAVIANPNLQQKIMAIFDNPAEGQRFIDSLQRQAATYVTGKRMVAAGEKGLATSQQPTSISQMLRTRLMRPGTAGEIAETMGTMANDPEAKTKIGRLQRTADALRNQKELSTGLGTATAVGAGVAGTPSPMQSQ